MKINDAKTLGQIIRSRRKIQGFTQQDVADFTGMSTSFISDVENGKPSCEINKCIKLANVLGLDININER